MKKNKLSKKHREKLIEYGLQNMPSEACCCLKYYSGEEVLREGSPIFWLSLVIEGRAKVCRAATNGKSLILCYNVANGMIGEIELMTKQKIANSTVIAITDFECIAINYQNCIAELKSNVIFLNKLGIELAEKLTKSADNFTYFGFIPITENKLSYKKNFR